MAGLLGLLALAACNDNETPVFADNSRPGFSQIDKGVLVDTTMPFGAIYSYDFTAVGSNNKKLSKFQFYQGEKALMDTTFGTERPSEFPFYRTDTLKSVGRLPHYIYLQDTVGAAYEHLFSILVSQPISRLYPSWEVVNNIVVQNDSAQVNVDLIWKGAQRLDSVRLSYGETWQQGYKATKDTFSLQNVKFALDSATTNTRLRLDTKDKLGLSTYFTYPIE